MISGWSNGFAEEVMSDVVLNPKGIKRQNSNGVEKSCRQEE